MANLKELPKTEIHSHLDCTLSFEAVNILSPATCEEEYFDKYVAPPRCVNLSHYLEYTRNCVNLLQSKESPQVSIKDLFNQLADENVIYSEIRFAPHLHTKQGLGSAEIVETVEAAFIPSDKKVAMREKLLAGYSK
jgi:adenosine deaminase